MDEIWFDGKRFTKFGNYWRRSRKFLHRAIWEKANGPIPKGCHVHHKDGDRENNDLGNLEIKDGRRHISDHQKGHARDPVWAYAPQKRWRSASWRFS